MQYELIKPTNPHYSTLEQILTNRGIAYDDINHYINTTDNDINDFRLLGEDKLYAAAVALTSTMTLKEDCEIGIIVDSDCDGFTSAALLLNYLYELFPAFVQNNVCWYIHNGKQHGLNDCVDWVKKNNCKLVILPDAGTNDKEAHRELKEAGITTICLDHHEVEGAPTQDAIVINSQVEPYPNEFLSGVGVTYQFCRYLDDILGVKYADKFLDLVALGNDGDMMSLRSCETKHLIHKGFEPDNVHNPFIYAIWHKNQFKLGEHITPWGATFYIVPLVNAIVRSGTQEEKEIVFESMLTFRAFEEIPSNKRGHKFGEMEKVVDQALRTCTNVKNRQERTVEKVLSELESKIEEEHLLDNKVLLFLLEPGQVDPNVAGLVANKFMAKYQRPCCILTNRNGIYSGSARGCDSVGVIYFKDICSASDCTEFVAGHQGAFGLAINEDNIQKFIENTNDLLIDMRNEPIYQVDYIYEGTNVDPINILDIAAMGDLWGKDMNESYVAVRGLKVTADMLRIMKGTTLKITLPNKVSIIKFGSSEDEYQKLLSDGFVKIDLVGRCNRNEWNGYVTPQILLEDYDIVDRVDFVF